MGMSVLEIVAEIVAHDVCALQCRCKLLVPFNPNRVLHCACASAAAIRGLTAQDVSAPRVCWMTETVVVYTLWGSASSYSYNRDCSLGCEGAPRHVRGLQFVAVLAQCTSLLVLLYKFTCGVVRYMGRAEDRLCTL